MIGWIKHVLRVLFTGSSFLLFFSGGTVLALIILPIVRLFTRGEAEKAAACRQWVADAWIFFHDYMRFWGLISHDPRTLMKTPLPEGPIVVVANHPTLVDVTAIISAWGRLVCVAKPVHFKSPLIGRLLRYCDYIRSGDAGLFSAATVVTNGVEALQKGAAILIFPEGTRSPKHGLHTFRQGAFEMAARANVPVLPLFITCNPPTLMRGQPWYDVPERRAEMTIEILPLIRPPHGDPKEMAERMQREYGARLEAFLAGRDAPAAVPDAEPVEPRARVG